MVDRDFPRDRWARFSLPRIEKAARTTQWLFVIVLLALIVRLSLMSHPGHASDLRLFKAWAKSATEYGVVTSYRKQPTNIMPPNHPPLAIAAFALTGHAYRLLVSPEFNDQSLAYHIFIKFPAVLADLATIVLLFFAVSRSFGKRAGLIGAVVYGLNPAVFYDSAVWGQTDSLFTFFLVASLFAAQKRSWLLVGALAAVSLAFKMQAVMIGPVLLLLALTNRHALWKMFLGGLAVACTIILPFAIESRLEDLVNVYRNSVGFYSNLSMGAYNFWLALYDGEAGRNDTLRLFGPISYRRLGFLLFAGFASWVLLSTRPAIQEEVVRRGKGIAVLFPAAALIAYAFFVFNTEMHERYLFPYIALGLPLIFTGKRGAWLYGLTSLFFLGNLMGILNFGSGDRAFFEEVKGVSALIASGHVFLLVLTVLHLGAYARSVAGGGSTDSRDSSNRSSIPTLVNAGVAVPVIAWTAT